MSANKSKTFQLNLLLSAKVAKFLQVKEPDLRKLSDWGDWESSEHHWFSNWRCEDYSKISKSKHRVLLLTNLATRYSVIISTEPSMPSFFDAVYQALMVALNKIQVCDASDFKINIHTLSGASKSLSSYQNQVRFYLDVYTEMCDKFDYLVAEERVNTMLTSLSGEYIKPQEVFEDRCKEQAPFEVVSNVIPFKN